MEPCAVGMDQGVQPLHWFAHGLTPIITCLHCPRSGHQTRLRPRPAFLGFMVQVRETLQGKSEEARFRSSYKAGLFPTPIALVGKTSAVLSWSLLNYFYCLPRPTPEYLMPSVYGKSSRAPKHMSER